MSAFTRLGSGIWDWEPFQQLDPGPQVLWLALYTSAEAKRIVPGLFHGSITAMAEAAHKPVDEARSYLDKLLDADMVEFEIKLRVLRLTKLPDAGESPANPNVLRGWFRKFMTVPACSVRDAHVTLVRWLMDEWSRENAKPISIAHEQAWQETFGRIVVPAPRRRGVRRLAESDTSTPTQPSLFCSPQTVSREPLALPERASVDNSDALRKMNDSAVPETVTQTVSKRYGSGSGLGSGSGSSESGNRGPLPSGASGGGERDQLDQLLALISAILGGTWSVAQSTPERFNLEDQIIRLGGLDLALLGRWMRGTRFDSMVARDLLAIPGRLVWAAQAAERWHAEQEIQEAKAAEQMNTLRGELAALGLGTLVQ